MQAKTAVVLLALLAVCVSVSAGRNPNAVMIFLGSRQYEVENPQAVSGSPALHIFYHGRGGWCDQPNEPRQIAEAAAAQGLNMLVIAPCGVNHGWDTGAYGSDWTFTQQMIEDTKKRYNIDPKKVFISGFSMGGMLTSVLACEHSDQFVGAALLDGAFDCGTLRQPIHLMAIEGTDDGVCPRWASNAYNSFAKDMGCNPGDGDHRAQTCNGKFMQLDRVAGGGHFFFENDPLPFSDSKAMAIFFKKCLGMPSTPVTCSSADESGSVSVNCADGVGISDIKFASYGTPTGSCANGFAVNPSCDSNTTLSVARAACLGQNSCSLSAQNSVFGDPCYGTQKKLALSVVCSGKLAVTCGTASEGGKLDLTCGDKTIKSVDFASYGTPTGACFSSFATSSCHSSTSKSVLEQQCVGKNSCTVDATNAVFGDPCVGTGKQLAAKVTCA